MLTPMEYLLVGLHVRLSVLLSVAGVGDAKDVEVQTVANASCSVTHMAPGCDRVIDNTRGCSLQHTLSIIVGDHE